MADDQRDDQGRPAGSGRDAPRGPGGGEPNHSLNRQGGPEGQTYGEAGGYNQEPGQSYGGFGDGHAGGGYGGQGSSGQGAGGYGGGQGYTGQTGTGYGQTAGGGYGQAHPQHEGGGQGLWGRAKHAVSGVFGSGDAPGGGAHRGRGPKGYSRSDERIQDDVNDRLTDDPFLDATHIEVGVQGGEVTLSGTVTARVDKRRAEDLADDVSGVKHVQNNLRVQEVQTDADASGAHGGTPSSLPETSRTGSMSGNSVSGEPDPNR
jgi:osmotically-inducible protein OsmY